ncbi:uncharacterized protein LOC129583219 [Paramacrobiotus metropolitanus]|uniref:uncharacterized protein LOC129583219 n=1 Tax=Paramacrobiotus metropolitanus TaxID=2943436 RepID=UPI0024458F41|nr:uncharacterized protein LOC129583219 [Paramacrobiotus metropolitanus]XP_055330897.1 uncharacterized protein LOC129583219 [Paramacrobiotus metropolitanus]
MFLRLFFAFILFEACLGQFFTNGRYGKRSQGVIVDDQGASLELGSLSAADGTNPHLACIYTGYQDLFRCQRLPADSSGRITSSITAK